MLQAALSLQHLNLLEQVLNCLLLPSVLGLVTLQLLLLVADQLLLLTPDFFRSLEGLQELLVVDLDILVLDVERVELVHVL